MREEDFVIPMSLHDMPVICSNMYVNLKHAGLIE